MLEVMFVIGFLSYMIQNAVSDISYAVRGELPPRAQLKMAQMNAAAGGAAPAALRYRVRDYLGDWISDALQQARDERRERLDARRRGDDLPPEAGGTDGVDQAPKLATNAPTARARRTNTDDLDDDDLDEPGSTVIHGDGGYHFDSSGRGLWAWNCRRPHCTGKGFDLPTEQAAYAEATAHEQQHADAPPDPGPGTQVIGPPPASTVGDAPDLATAAATARPAPNSTPAAATAPAGDRRAATAPAPQQPTAAQEEGIEWGPVPTAPTMDEQLLLIANLLDRCGVPRSGPGGGERCGSPALPDSVFCLTHERMATEHPEQLAELLGETPGPRRDTEATANAPTGPPARAAAPARATEPGAPAEENRPQLRLVHSEDAPAGDPVPGATGGDDCPAPSITDPGHTGPEQGDSTVSTNATAETTNIDAAKAFLTELGEHITDDLLAKVQTAAATLAGKNIDSDTLAILAKIQEQGQVLAGLCTDGVEHIDSYHGLMQQAVNNTEEVAETDFYRSR